MRLNVEVLSVYMVAFDFHMKGYCAKHFCNLSLLGLVNLLFIKNESSLNLWDSIFLQTASNIQCEMPARLQKSRMLQRIIEGKEA